MNSRYKLLHVQVPIEEYGEPRVERWIAGDFSAGTHRTRLGALFARWRWERRWRQRHRDR